MLGIAAGLFTAWVERTYIGAQGAEFELSATERVLLAGRALWFYASTLVWPSGLTFIYPRWEVDRAVAWHYLFPLAALGVVGALWRWRRHTRAPLAAALLFAGTLFPVLGFFNVFPFRYSFVADHFQYLASIPLIALGAAVLHRAVPGAASFLVLIPLVVLTWRHAGDFKDAETLYRATLERNPQCWLCHNNLATARLSAVPPRLEEALAHQEAALRINPQNPEGLNNYGATLRALGRYQEAVRAHEASLELAPNNAAAHNNLGVALQALGRREEALASYRHALGLDPRSAEAHHNIGRVLQELGRPADALPHIEEALRLQPGYADAHENLGHALLRLGRTADAEVQFRAALQLRPNAATVHHQLAELLLDGDRPAEAIPHFERALADPSSIDPAQVHNNLGIALAMTGQRDRAIAHFEEALRLRPGFREARDNLTRARMR
jgi:Tfp pilus assembly protein PilF